MFFWFIIPTQIESTSIFFPVLGSLLICLFSYLSLIYYKTWELEFVKKHETPEINYHIFGLMFIPGVILYFIISSRFENLADNLLKENQIEVTGKIISGEETEIQNRRGNIQISTIVVEFLTKEGNKIIAYEDIGHYEFQNFYLNQEVNLIYSKTNPQNISLLMSNKNITKFKNSKEKDILPEDMLK